MDIDEYGFPITCGYSSDGYIYCENKPKFKCKTCDTEICESHGSATLGSLIPENDTQCNICINIQQEIGEAKRKDNECFFQNCEGLVKDKCNLCDRLICDTHDNDGYCYRCEKAIKNLGNELKEDDQYNKREYEDIKKLSAEDYNSYLFARRFGGRSDFWTGITMAELDKDTKEFRDSLTYEEIKHYF